MANNLNRGALPMLKLTFPIAMEQFFRILVSSVDTMMLSSYSNDAVAAVGLVSQYSFFLVILMVWLPQVGVHLVRLIGAVMLGHRHKHNATETLC